ncbi:MAG: helix-turn-helix domain-containing protein [Alphaproteobacteria bacterium]|nr:helix-turn-helix domain-containing protein [Alphaproteobacteria bacterium]
MDIAEVSRRSGLPASTLRFYEEKGLINSVGRRGLRRLFDGNILEQLSMIALARYSGFSLDEITSMFSIDSTIQINRKTLFDKAEELDQKIKKLTAMRDGLRHAAKCKAPRHLECPTFQRLLKVAGKAQLKGKKNGK